ncbi:TetR/AcrR family transcriptional regulator [Streptomyces aidingensis]|uniref:DNA-binding transcriptional regulator, AcrR family n=1 Tax=Streptomyces aidingensis TaxID=910347 RepID=A0A1I1E406_9ACTN|nr:TetR/AcrR family transcriptional regulator [Streptomyces aidingensis]SFB81955.1 DNA-binding transcriptional regulator, AcrR family [Streptomyces aidingensis]
MSARLSAEERRESVIRAAIAEFAHGGYAGTSTAAIARRVGVSQPYLFRLFPDKRAIFLAAARRCTEQIRRRFAEAGDGPSPEQAKEAMAEAYNELITNRDQLLFQMQMYVAAAVAEQAGDADFAAQLRSSWEELWDLVHLRLGAVPADTSDFMATGMLVNVLLAMGFPAEHRVWTGLGEKGVCPPGGAPPG